MAIVYINLHPNYSYATAIIGEGYFDIRDYVKHIDWLTWDMLDRVPQIRIHGTLGDHEKAKSEHMERAAVFAERMTSFGCKVLVRNERGEKWSQFERQGLSEEEMQAIEYQRCHEFHEERWAKERIEKYGNLLVLAKEQGNPVNIALVEKMLSEGIEWLDRCQKEEAQRIEAIKDFWEAKKAKKQRYEEWERKLDEVMAKKYQNEQAVRKGESS